MKTWNRGKKKLTPEQKIKAEKFQKERVKITNMVRRRPLIEKTCRLCGKPRSNFT